MPTLATTRPAQQRREPCQRGDVFILLANATASLELLGELTGRETDATVLIKLARESFGG
ncbi:hypothetical protein E6C67_14310 [Azospirillum sp. TSA2s]|uniref:hypothetical protein n=1 Tax=Azospirillum sp. TSA2s TaxID=709810 RepID=UPI0010AB0651|nr:hypothetical protein [Azospirillum sp. TSA2s]QCG95001.1 hypothetical protein E6C67_14310 [Azospirillum sp. TSA2s]